MGGCLSLPSRGASEPTPPSTTDGKQQLPQVTSNTVEGGSPSPSQAARPLEMTIDEARRWAVCRKLKPGATYRMICLPWAGGNSTIYRNYELVGTEVVAMELPGRMTRIKEKPITDFHVTVSGLAKALDLLGYLSPHSMPLIIFGHSMGTMLAINLGRYLRDHYGFTPYYIIISGCSPLHLRGGSTGVSKMADDDVVKHLMEMGGIPPEIAANRELMDIFLPAIKGDYTAIDDYVYEEKPPLSCPLLCLGGEEDDRAPIETMGEWKAYTTSDFTLKIFPGGHFYLKEIVPQIIETIEKVVLKKDDEGRIAQPTR